MAKIDLTIFVSPMGHDVNRACKRICRWLDETGAFNTRVVGTYPDAEMSIGEYMSDVNLVRKADVFFFICTEQYFNTPELRKNLEDAVANGTGIVFFHGQHPAYQDWAEAEKMLGLLWRETGWHGDFGDFLVKPTEKKHPITEGVKPFHTKEELFCGLTNVWNVPLEVLMTSYSDEKIYNRHSQHGTGKDEPVLTTGTYGKGRCVDFLLGHVWPYYTGHGLYENTMIAFKAPEFKTLLLRSLEWAATGEVVKTKNV